MKNAIIAAIVAMFVSASGVFAATAANWDTFSHEQNQDEQLVCLHKAQPNPIISGGQVAGYETVSRQTLTLRYLDCMNSR
jgi:hypothetical protein